MIDKEAFFEAFEDIIKEYKLGENELLAILGRALTKAYEKSLEREGKLPKDKKRRKESGIKLTLMLDATKKKFQVYQVKKVVKEVKNPLAEVAYDEVVKKNKKIKEGMELLFPFNLEDFSRVSVSIIRQIMIQELNERKKGLMAEKIRELKGKLVRGKVWRITNHGYAVTAYSFDFEGLDTVTIDAFLPFRLNYKSFVRRGGGQEKEVFDSRKRPRFRVGDEFVAVVEDLIEAGQPYRDGERIILGKANMPRALLSRTSPMLMKKILEREIAPIRDGMINIERIVRAPGIATKVAVSSTFLADPVRKCLESLRRLDLRIYRMEREGERVEFVKFEPENEKMLAEALKAKRMKTVVVAVTGPSEAIAVVEDTSYRKLSGIELKLIAQLSGFERIEILKQSEYQERFKKETEELISFD